MTEGIWIVSGIPGAGKTTVARLLAQRLGRGVHIEADRLQELIASGSVWPSQQPAEEAERQLRLRTRNCCLLADSFYEAGFLPVIDDVVIVRPRLDDFLHDLRSRPVSLAQLAPRKDVAQQRDAARGYKQVFSVWGHLDAVLHQHAPDLGGLWLDTSDMTAAETVDAILRRRDEALLPDAHAARDA